MGQMHCAVRERHGTPTDLEERCREVERMLRERDPSEGFEWPAPEEPERPEHPRSVLIAD